MLKRYNSGFAHLLEMNLVDGLSLINKALEKEMEERAWEFYLAFYPHQENPKSFDQVLAEVKSKQTTPQTKLSKEEIIRRAEAIKKADQRR
ncbi:hypothetical protein [Thermoflavimicrobium dichotomicum]|uniref:Uncharacterized protein n=1 Tax=Thermoflavimicrobium dichotomicum TaxID=46223 RepID=A0A1I3UIJ8_9BACL|nr:hypothetical protein [Thermoflavimicrobium dichotomicum]SFJ83304.1 hypothetical protein SAMN05421852_12547 [Thermoflavimicrobium dichotomicum]